MAKKMQTKKMIFMVAIVALISQISAIETALASVKIKNKVNSSSNTGGNSGSNIHSGDATSKSSVKVEVDKQQSGKNEIKTFVKAQANEVTEELQAQNDQEISIQKGDNPSSVEISIDQESIPNEIQLFEEEVRDTNDGKDGLLMKIYLFIKNILI